MRNANIHAVLLLLAAASLAMPADASPSRVRFLEGADAANALPPGAADETVTGYLGEGAAALVRDLVPPPADGSPEEKADTDLFRIINRGANAARWSVAVEDDASVYPRFATELGVMPDRTHLPRLVRLLNRIAEDAMAAANAAKAAHPRLRPFQRFPLRRVCGMAKVPAPSASSAPGTSWPSGHATVSWAVALAMAEVAPAQATRIISRAAAYGDSRVVCGLHFPADIDAGRALGAALMDRLLQQEDFRRDVMCARQEYNGVKAGTPSADQPACG